MVFVDWLNCRAVVTSYAVTGLLAVGQWLPGATGMTVLMPDYRASNGCKAGQP